jgi:hypothetical protein
MPSPDKPSTGRELVTVCDTAQETEAMVIQSLLESAGIESLITPRDNPQDVLPVGGVVVRVSAEDAEEARRIIQDYRDHPEAEILLDEEEAAGG